MDSTLQKKLKAYSITAGSLTLAAAAQGQIVYTDVVPDRVVDSSDVYALDFNADAVSEIDFTTPTYIDSAANVYNYAQIYVAPPLGNAVLGNLFMNMFPLPTALNAGDSIRPGATDWRDAGVNNGDQYLAVVTPLPGPTYGNWVGISDKYIGARFVVGAQTHYGWVRLSVSTAGNTITIKEYAYNGTPGVGIVAGQTTAVGITEQPEGTPQLHVYEHTLFVNLPATTPADGFVEIFNTAGQSVQTTPITDSTMHIALNELPSGVYFAQVVQADGTRTSRKIYVN